MARTALNTTDIPIDQKPVLTGEAAAAGRDGGRIETDPSLNSKDRLESEAFNEEPVTIQLAPSTDKNAALAVPVWVNGKGAEVFTNGRWIEMTWLPVNQPLTIKRKYLEVLLRAKQDIVTTHIVNPEGERPDNQVRRHTTGAHTLTIIEDRNPRGRAWATEMLRRQF